MLDSFRGCLLGAAIGDALGMPGETTPPNLGNMRTGYRRAWKAHPNAALAPGQYTDDTQMMLLVADLFVHRTYSVQRYAERLKDMFLEGELRFPDGSVSAACEHLLKQGPSESGVLSTTAGCISLAVPFALLYPDSVDLREHLVQACAVTHTHPAAHAAAISCAMLLHGVIHGARDPLHTAQSVTIMEDMTLGEKIRSALQLEKEGISIEAALSAIGNDVSVFQTLPIAYFLISRYEDVEELLTVATNIGGNTDTIGFICGAYAGAAHGTASFPPDLVLGLENRDRIETLAERLFELYAGKD
jgi:ADP-ribosylglycohydrolase